MMRRFLLCLLFLLPGVSLAAGSTWIAQMEEDEGGPVMVASVEADAGGGTLVPMLRLMCGASGEFALRYETSTEGGEPASEADFLFENETAQLTRHLAFEEMDGAFAGYFPVTDPLLALLRVGASVTVSEANGNLSAQAFSLKGSSKAIATLLKHCASS